MNDSIEVQKEFGYIKVLIAGILNCIKNNLHQMNAKQLRAIFDRLMAVEKFIHSLIQ